MSIVSIDVSDYLPSVSRSLVSVVSNRMSAWYVMSDGLPIGLSDSLSAWYFVSVSLPDCHMSVVM